MGLEMVEANVPGFSRDNLIAHPSAGLEMAWLQAPATPLTT